MAGEIGGFVGGASQLHAPRFAAASGVDLCFNDDDIDVRPQAVRGLARFFPGKSDFAARSVHAIARQDRLGLVFMNLHRGSVFSFDFETVC